MFSKKLHSLLYTSWAMAACLSLLMGCSSSGDNTTEGETVAAAQANSEQSPAQAVDKVPLIQPDDLEKLLENEEIILLDTRSPEEYETGHLENSRFVNFQTFQMQDVQDIPKDAQVVVYCAVGGRSNRVGMQLISAGYENVRNLEGGITNWKNQGHEVVYD